MINLRVDLDLFLFRGLFACQDQGYYAGIRAIDSMLLRTFDRFDSPPYIIVTSGPTNFRKQISPEYKANRKPESRPQYLYDARNYYIKYWNTVVSDGIEADDLLGILCEAGTVLVTSDKDFKQLGYPIYNPFKDEYYEVDNPKYHFWMQMCTGDSSDNIKTLPGIGPKKAEKILEGKSDEEMKEVVINKYKEVYKDEWYTKFDLTARLLFLRRKDHQEYYTWI